METFNTDSVEDTRELGEQLASRLRQGDFVALTGPLGAGKTALVSGLAVGLGVPDRRVVSSPTYVLVQEYAGRVTVYHMDLHRLAHAPDELADLGVGEMLADGVVLAEWADRAGDALPRPHLRIDIQMTGPSSRTFSLQTVT